MGFAHGFAVVGSQEGFCCPFLLEEGAVLVGWIADAGEVVEVVFGPGLPDFLDGVLVGAGSRFGSLA